jgi:DNA-binding NtrC family response regulator
VSGRDLFPPGSEFDDRSTAVAPRRGPGPISTPVFAVTVVDGPDRGAQLVVDGGRPSAALVGHGPACDLRLTDRQASRRHLALDVVDERLHLVDLGSTNGTVVNDVAVVDAYLRGGEIVRLGGTALRVERRAEATLAALAEETSFGRVVGESREMRRLYPLCRRLAQAEVAVVLEGETGTGKELLAESFHEHSRRAPGPFVVFDCTAVPPTLVESELFGHERGAFTGATATRKGVFEQADGGTLLLDEIGDLETALQPKLLRALERSEIRRVGGDRTISVDVRILAATRRDLDREVQVGRFRDDLFHRLAVARVELPPLRARRGDVRLLARGFATQLGGDAASLPEHLLIRWEDYSWPGNVRELRNAVVRWLALGEVEPDRPLSDEPKDAAPGALERVLGENLPYSAARQRVLQEFERAYIERVLAEHGGNVLRAAAASGIARRHLQRVRARHQGGK